MNGNTKLKRIERRDLKLYVQLRRPGTNNIQTAAANQLQMQLNLGNGPNELDVIPIIETYKDIQITVIDDVS
jgi:hypothetical protein